MTDVMNYFYVLLTIIFTVLGQLIIKWQVVKAGALPVDLFEKTSFLLHLLLNPWIIIALFSAFLAALSWMVVMTKFELSHAYPFMSLSFILVIFLSGLIFNEAITPNRLIGLFFIVIGLIVGSHR